MYFDILNRLGMDHECDDWRTDRIAFSNIAHSNILLYVRYNYNN